MPLNDFEFAHLYSIEQDPEHRPFNLSTPNAISPVVDTDTSKDLVPNILAGVDRQRDDEARKAQTAGTLSRRVAENLAELQRRKQARKDAGLPTVTVVNARGSVPGVKASLRFEAAVKELKEQRSTGTPYSQQAVSHLLDAVQAFLDNAVE